MKRKILISILFSCLLVLAATNVSAETIAVVLKVRGNVSMVRSGQTQSQTLKRGYRLQHEDKIVTGKKGFAAVRFIDDASLIRIRGNSTCRIRGKKEKNQILKNVYLEVGTIFARVTQQKGKFEIATPTSVASVKGTEWITQHTTEGGTFYFGRAGVVEITNEAGSALLRAGETVEVPDDETAPKGRKSRPGEGVSEEDEGLDDFEFEFEDDSGQRKMMRFKIESQE